MPDYQVLAVKGSSQWNGTHGPMLSYTLTVRGPEGRELDCEINKKPDSKAPAVGETIDGTLKASDNPAFLPKLKANFSQGGGRGRGRSPEETAAIQRQHSQGCAVALLHVKAIAGKLADDDLLPSKIKTLADWFDDDIAAGVARKTPGMVHGLPVRNEPERTGTPEPTTPSAEYPQSVPAADVPFEAA